MKVLLLASLLLVSVAGCYSPAIPNGTQQCGTNGQCANGYQCGPDNRCYKNGQLPTNVHDMAMALGDLAMGCTAASCKNTPKPFCDGATEQCVECLTDDNCPSGKVCTNKACVPGCSAMHGCPDGGGACDNNSKMCKVCMKDGDCGGGTPRCDTNSGNCVECLPVMDNCPNGKFCGQVNSVYTCQTGCQTVTDCPGGDAGGKPACCNHVCVDTDVDGTNCGGCGTSCGNESCCAGFCSDVTKDQANCGLCGNACNGKHAMWTCMQSMCDVTSCSAGFGDCNGNSGDGCEATLATDASNCSKCGMKCTAQNGVGNCVNGTCGVGMCNAGFGDCNMLPNDGCEINLNGDPNNCGKCGTKCAFANATAACVNGGCVIASCNNGFSNCDNNPANGCESNNGTDINNCGVCNMVCGAVPNANLACQSSKCVITSCNGGFKDCDMTEGDGCEVSTVNNVNNCGACGTKCMPGANVATAGCASSACTIASCNAGFGDCNGIVADGCETNTNTSSSNCGKCGMACPNGGSCVAGVCSSCDPATGVSFNGHCYYLDGSGGVCDQGYALASQSVLTNIAAQFIGKTYRHTVSNFCCIWNADANENWGFPFPGQCNAAGPFTQAPVLGGANCNNVMIFQAGGLTFCGN